ncbi:MerR family transcriptional regulator [Streptomyces sp. NBC_00996]|uniref:MerR family transcriptional regulator n=1 Tax=Streptomyces sp. NBC_00996 TaxID=2903710 RepID=UPI003868E5B0|nr:MerR family transcriptional regulator [Streptomyces sp. NBC_00996]
MTVIDSTPVKSPPVDVCVPAGGEHPRPDGHDRYTISEVAAFTGLRAHTLRWYEQIGLMPHVARSPNGRRLFCNRDLDWLAFVGKLRLTGMPVAAMVQFAELVRQGEVTYDERREILEQTRHEVVVRIADLQDTLAVLDVKIDFYTGARRAPEGA